MRISCIVSVKYYRRRGAVLRREPANPDWAAPALRRSWRMAQ
jgi:hypothetical protein